MNQRSIGIGLSYINMIIQTIVNFLYVPILLYYMGQSEYGLYQLMGSVVAYFSVMDFGLTASTIRLYIKYKTENNFKLLENFLAMTQRIYFFICLMTLVVGFCIYIFLDEIFKTGLTNQELMSAKYIFILLIFNMIITFMGMMYRSVIIANEKFLFMKGIETIQLILQPFAVIAMMRIESTALAMVFVMTVINLIVVLMRMYYCHYRLKIIIKYFFWDKDAFKEMSKLSLSVFVVTIVDQIFWKTNQVILGIISGTAIVAIYSIASLIYMNYMALSTTISGIYLPKITKMVVNRVSNKILSNEFLRIGRLQYYLLGLVLSGFFVFGKEFIVIWTNEDFIEAYYITLIIIIPFTIDLIQNIGSIIMKAKNVYDFRAKIYFIIGVINIFLSILLANLYGSIGCAVACGFSILVSNLIMNGYFKKVLRLDILLFWKQILKITISVILCGFIGKLLNCILGVGNISILILKLLLYTLIYLIIMWITSFNKDEKILVLKLKNRLLEVKNIYGRNYKKYE